MSLSTRVSEKCSQTLREYSRRTGKSLGEVLDDLVSYAASRPEFEAYMTQEEEPSELRTAEDLLSVPTLKAEPGRERSRTSVVSPAADGAASIEITLAAPDGALELAGPTLASTTDEVV